jgi:DNA polymerase III alpha subunit
VIERLADADAFGSLGLTRRHALWAAKALGRVGDKDDDLPLFRSRINDVSNDSDIDPSSEPNHIEHSKGSLSDAATAPLAQLESRRLG